MNPRIIHLVPACARRFDPELRSKVPRSRFKAFSIAKHIGHAMDETEKYRQYAAECRRLAEKAAAKDKVVLLEIAEAWLACAERAGRGGASGKGPSHK